ncbi:MAG: hypothetical protein C0475_05330 [Planctomyces sp.]|nr:hypothetical protein [Planctomyces sp.]MBA4039640.1 hypothetical protein [Planctomyces sp.]MBA4119978.1 hypothetical protein [Isosphaera sp.]
MTPRRALTIIEIICVIVILGALAGVVAPRLFSGGSARLAVQARRVSGFLSGLAQRQALTGGERLALWYRAPNRELVLLAWSPDPDAPGVLGQDDPWVVASGVPPVVLDGAAIVLAAADGAALPTAQDWRLEITGGLPRPSISIVIAPAPEGQTVRADLTGPAWQIDLPPLALEAIGAPIQSPQAWSPAEAAGGVDLDSAGRRVTPW